MRLGLGLGSGLGLGLGLEIKKYRDPLILIHPAYLFFQFVIAASVLIVTETYYLRELDTDSESALS